MVKIGIGFLLTALAGMGIGYWMTPTKVVKKTEYVERVVTKRDTKTVIVREPNGTVTTVIENKDRINEDKKGNSVTTIENKKPDWMLSGSYLRALDGRTVIVGSLQRRIIGQVFVGVTATNSAAGIGVTILF